MTVTTASPPASPPPPPARLDWRRATLVARVVETPRVTSLFFEVPDWPGHRAGQHVDVRLTAEDGYQVERSYSIASAPEEARVTLTVERLDDGEVSPYLTDELRVGEPLELRGPIGGYFVWDDALREPALLVGGGSGVVPLMAMIRHRAARGLMVPTRLLYSVRSPEDAIYHAELERLAAATTGLEVVYTYTRSAPDGWTGYHRRLDAAMLTEVCWPVARAPLAFICGPTRFVETAADGLRGLGYAAARIKTERFGAADEEATLDGNAAAGALHTVFGREMTLAVATCDACGAADDIGGLVAYMRAPGTVLRCRSCANVLLRVVHGRGRYWIDLRGVRSLRIDD